MLTKDDTPGMGDASLTDLMKMASQTNQAVRQIGEIVDLTNMCLNNGLQLIESGAPYSDSVLHDLKSMAGWVRVLTQEVEQISTVSIAVLTGSMNKMVKGFQKQVIAEALAAAEGRKVE